MLDPETGEPAPEAAIDATAAGAFDDLVRAAQLAVAEATSISGALSVPARGVDRQTWARTTLSGLEPVLAELATALGRGQQQPVNPSDPAAMSPDAFFGMLMQQLVPLLLGGWAGSMIGLLSHHALGQYDLPLPLSGEPGMLFVVRNVDGFAERVVAADRRAPLRVEPARSRAQRAAFGSVGAREARP